jgi:hypothetical protein
MEEFNLSELQEGNNRTLESMCLEHLENNLRNEDFLSCLITYMVFNLRDEDFRRKTKLKKQKLIKNKK